MSAIEIRPGRFYIPPFRLLSVLEASPELADFVLYGRVIDGARARRQRLRHGAVRCWTPEEIEQRTPRLIRGYIRTELTDAPSAIAKKTR